MLVLSREQVESLLDLDRLVEAVQAALVDVSAGRVSMPPRIAAMVPEQAGFLAAMPAYLESAGALTAKLVSLFPANASSPDRPTHHAVICCFDPANGAPLAVMDGSHVTAVRTAAGSVVATRLLARPDATVVAVIGTGVQARAHLRAFARLPEVAVRRVAGRDDAKVKLLVDELTAAGEGPVEAAPSIEDAVRSADIVCATTHADRPVVRRDWLRPGTHVNAVGYNPAGEGEVDAATVRDAVVVVESREAALAPPPSGAIEIHRAIDLGVIPPEAVLEIGEIVAGRAAGRTDPAQITLYKSVGVAVQDAAAAALVVEEAQRQGIGTVIEL